MLGEYVVYRLPNGEVLVDWNGNAWKYGYPAYSKHRCKEIERGMTEGGPALAKFAAQMRKKYETVLLSQKFDEIAYEYIFHKGWCINGDGLLELTAKQAEKEQYLGRSITNPDQRTLMIPSVHGCCLLFEGEHFIIKD